MFDIVTIATPGLGNRSYVASDGRVAVAIDPPRDIDRVLAVLDERGWRLTHVLETHIHNDYVTGGLELSRRTGTAYVVASQEEVAFDRMAVGDGDDITTGALRLRALHTPGHTPGHHAYVLSAGDQPRAVFTGGSMLYGTVGRTDLISAELTDALTRAQFQSARRLADLPGDVAVYPTHGFGSFCSSATGTDADASTIAEERRHNAALTTADEDAFVALITAGLGAYPRYYARMGPINRAGPAAIDLSPPQEVSPERLREHIHAGAWVVDVRERTAFAAQHLDGTINVELADSLATYLGWTITWGTPVLLVGDTAEQVATAQRMIARIGIDDPAGRATGGPDAFAAGGDVRAYRVADFAGVAAARSNGGAHVLDVRRDDEWDDGHIAGAQHIPLPDLGTRVDEVPDDTPSWVHCASGYRAAIAASLLDRAGKPVVLINDDWANAAHAGLPVT